VNLDEIARQAIERNRRRLAAGAQVGAWEFDIASGVMVRTADFYSVLGMPAGEQTGTLGLLSSVCHSVSHDAAHDTTRLLQAGRSFDTPLVISLSDGSTRHLRVTGSRTHRSGKMTGTVARGGVGR